MSFPPSPYLLHEETSFLADLSVEDVSNLSQKFWDMHTDPVTCLDGAATTLLTIQYNLVAGTLARYIAHRDDIKQLLTDVLTFNVM